MMEEALSVAKDAHNFSRLYQTLNRLEALATSLTDKITAKQKEYDSAKRKGDENGCTVLAAELLKMQLSHYGLVKEKIEVVKQFNEMVAINKNKLAIALEHLGKAYPKTPSSKIIAMHEKKSRSKKQKKRDCHSSQMIENQD